MFFFFSPHTFFHTIKTCRCTKPVTLRNVSEYLKRLKAHEDCYTVEVRRLAFHCLPLDLNSSVVRLDYSVLYINAVQEKVV